LVVATSAQAAPAFGSVLSAPQATTVNVAVLDSGFDPPSLAVPVGTVVVWTNKGAAPHTVTAVDGSFASDDLAPGATFPYQFAQIGTFQYRDIHTTNIGVITVVAGSLQGASVPTTTATTTNPPVASPGSRAGGPTMAFTGTSDWILAAVASMLLLLGTSLVRNGPAAEPFQVDHHTALAIERARRRREEFLPRRRRFLNR
jgi:plastocyanin